MTSNIDRDIGNMDARLGTLESDMHDVKTDVRDIRDILMNAKGGWKMLVVVGGISAGVTTALLKVIPYIPLK